MDVLQIFPRDREEALTYLYLQHMDIGNMSPQQLVDEYMKTKGNIYDRFRRYKSGDIAHLTEPIGNS